MRSGLALLAACLAVTAAALAYMALNQAGTGSLDERTQAVAATLKCPVCHDLSVADSPAPVAQEMRAQIRTELQAGESPDQIRSRFVRAYGDWILLTPPPRGFDLSLWLAPLLVALLALAMAALALRRSIGFAGRTEPPLPAISPEDRQLLDRELARAGPE